VSPLRPFRRCAICNGVEPCAAHKPKSRWPKSAGHYDGSWREVRNGYLERHRNCECLGCTAPAQEVDHIVPIRLDPRRRLDPTNLRALCVHHHRSRSAHDSNRTERKS
jgi:5-methylcytosine-specific restriction protein A